MVYGLGLRVYMLPLLSQALVRDPITKGLGFRVYLVPLLSQALVRDPITKGFRV